MMSSFSMAREFNREESMKTMAEAEERFKSDDLDGAMQLAERAYALWPSLPHLSNFLIQLEILLTAADAIKLDHFFRIRTSVSALWHAILESKPTEDVKTIKNRYRRLCLQIHPDRNPTAAAAPAFRIVRQAWDNLKDNPHEPRRFDEALSMFSCRVYDLRMTIQTRVGLDGKPCRSRIFTCQRREEPRILTRRRREG